MNVEELRKLAMSLPNTTEDVKWGADLCFCIGEKMYCVTGLERTEFGASFKVKTDEFTELIEREGIVPAPYLARYKWVYVAQRGSLSHKEWEFFIRQSYELVKSKLSKKKLRELKD